MKRRIVSLLLVICTLITLIPLQAFAVQQTDPADPANRMDPSDPANTASLENPFADVGVGDWFYDAVQYVYENNIFNGTSDTKFTPSGTMTRGMFVTVLGRMAGVDREEYDQETAFTDVGRSAYYAPYVAWAAKHGITSGTGDGRFSPDALINREQMATFFVRYFEIFGVEFDTNEEIDTIPADIDQVSDYAREAVLKLWKTGLLSGDGVNFNPKANASRAQAAALCMRTDASVEVWYKEPGVPSQCEREGAGVKNDEPGQKSARTVYYNFRFVTNGGPGISDRSIRSGAKLNNLPVPYKENALFVGWCYDEELTQLAANTDTAQKSTILYAKYEELPPLNEEFLTPVASAIDADKFFSISVAAPADMTIEEFMEGVSLKNLSSNENRDWFSITGSNGSFTISGVNYLGEQGAQQPGFVEGSAYKITLENNRLSFKGQDEDTCEYVFTIKREEIVNVSLNADMKQISLYDISDLIVNGAKASAISIPVITVGADGAPAENGITKGSFTFSKGTLAVGDTIMIYEGDAPPAMDAVNSDENTAFVEITDKIGNLYTYKTASAENVLFTPDILPVSVEADTDGDPGNNSMTVPVSAMTYTDDHFAMAGLDSMTTIDPGDFISFYSGTLTGEGTLSEGGVLCGYARITSVEESEGSYIIAYQPVVLSDVQQAMAAYKKENIASEDLLEGVDKEAIEESVEKQALESGFAEEAGMYLAALALETDSFTQLSDEFELTAVKMTMNGQPITQETLKSMGGVKADVELSKLQATLNNRLVHFSGLKGLRLTLDVGVKVSIQCNDDVTIEIEIVGSFEQEVRIDIGVDGDAVWKWWGIFPYIAEYEVTAFVELYEYTGIGIEATIATIETEEDGFGTKNETIEKIGKQIKDLMDEKDKYLGDGLKTVGDSLEEKYSDMLGNETDWVTLFEKALIDQDFNVLLVIAINVEVKFVVSANLNISLGMDFWYENAKRYVYTIQVFSNKVKSDVIDLVEEHWEFEFYVMGTMGLRVGIRAGISVGLLSTKLASVGFAAEAGAYVRVWGYFYYQLKYTASQGRSSSYSGAIYLEFGVYLEVTFEAQAIGGKFSYEKSLFDKEWPLLKAGDKDNVRDFAYTQKAVPGIKLKSYITSARLPDSVFSMAYLDLKEGMEKDEKGNRVLSVANYDAPLEEIKKDVDKEKLDDEKNFIIQMTNPAFSYDPHTNTVSVTPGSEVKHEGEMTITWKSRPMEFSSVPIRRTIPLYWDNLKDGYIIAPFTDGGSYVPFIIRKYEEAVTAPEDPVKLGYIFAGWYSDEGLTMPYTFPKTMPNVDTSIYAAWEPATDTPYTVEHYRQKLGSSEYELAERETFTGTTDGTVTPLTKSYTGFRAPEAQTLVIKADGSSILRYYYDRQTYTVTFEPGEAGGDPVVIRLKYGSTIAAPQFSVKGYIFKGWDKTVSTYMGDQDLTYTAIWEKDMSTEYRVEYYVQQPSGTYSLQGVVYRTGTTGDSIEAGSLRIDDAYAIEGETSFLNVTVNGENSNTIKIEGGGKTVVKVNYKREQHTVTFEPENGDEDIIYTLYSGAAVTQPEVSYLGFSFVGWSPEPPPAVGKTDLTFSALWDGVNGIGYRVKHIRQALDGSYPEDGELVEYIDMSGKTGSDTEAEKLTYEGFTAESFSQKKISYDGSTVVEIRYKRNTYPVHWIDDDKTETVQVKYGAVITKPEDPTKSGYVFDHWDGFAEQTIMTTADKTYTAAWRPAADTPYTVRHIGPDEEELEIETRYGITDTWTAAAAKNIDGFTATSVKQNIIKGDGKTVAVIHYDRKSYAVSWIADNQVFDTTNVICGDAVNQPGSTPVKDGHTFDKWLDIPEKMPAEDIRIEAEFAPIRYTVTLKMSDDEDAEQESIEVAYGSSYGKLPEPVNTSSAALQFERWKDEEDRTVREDTIVNRKESHTLTAVWADEDTMVYTVIHKLQDTTGDGYEENVETRYGQVGEYTTVKANFYKGFTAGVIEQAVIEDNGGTVVTVEYARNSHCVIWNINGDEIEETYLFGQTIIAPVPARAGYRFVGWGADVPDTMPDMDLEYTAQWMESTYTVSFDGNGGRGIDPLTVTYGGRYPALAESSRTGYTFDGWYTQAAGGNKAAAGDPVEITEDIILYAQWIPNEYIVSFDPNGLEGTFDDITVKYDEKYGSRLPEVTETRTGYYFSGWYTAPAGGVEITGDTDVMITGNSTLYARMVPITYTVRFVANDGSDRKYDQVHTYDKILALSDLEFSRPGYTFTGWNTKADGSGITTCSNRERVMNLTDDEDEVITLYAQWSINSYTVTFNSDGGTSIEAVTQTYGTVVEQADDPTKYGYNFVGWMNGEELITFPAALTDNLNLTAKWQAVEYTITYVNMDGVENSNPKTYTVERGSIILANPGTRTGYTFMGWYTNEDLSDSSRVIGIAIASRSTGARIFYANWKANVYGVNFDDGTESNNAGGSMSAQTFTYDVAQPLRNNEFTNPGYSLEGWALAPSSPFVYTDGESVKNLTPSGSITLYAQWKPIPYTISFTLGSGASGVNNPTTYTIETSDIMLKAPSGIKAGYRFLGWYSGDTEVTSIPKGSTGNVALKAMWEHGGTFTLAVTSEKVSGSARDVTFTVTRSFPADAVPTADIQYVYYRTVNGTAIGGTAAPIHFSHAGGEDIFLTFGPGDTSKTFVVRSERYLTGNDDIVNSFTNGVNRYYDVELYKVSSASQICTGTLGSTSGVRRTLIQGADYKLSSSIYTNEYTSVINTSQFTVKSEGYNGNKSFTIRTGYSNLGIKEAQLLYTQAVGNSFGLRVSMDATEEYDGYQYVKFFSSLDSSRTDEYRIEIVRGSRAKNWYTIFFPMFKTAGDVVLNTHTPKGMDYYNNYLLYTPGEQFTMRFNASGSGKDYWYVDDIKAYMKIFDTAEPGVKRIAPMAYGTYKKGDIVTIAVEFNEIVGSASNVTMSKIGAIPVNNWNYESGAGTNMLVFKGVLTSDFKVDPNMNMTLTGTKPTVGGTIRDIY